MDDPARPRPAAAVGRYREFELLEEIGVGGFARVYKVRAPGHRAPLALKLAAQTRLSPDTLKRAVREVAILRTLSNPHVAKLHGSSIGPDHFYVLMEYLEGQQLDHYHEFDEPMAVGEALKILLQACMGLAEAHARGVVHRDIKPANIWIQPDHTVKILDFGLARAWDVPWAYAANATAARMVVGTPHYCQPEQLHTDQLTPASDVYSLATILYELLSGHAVLFADHRVSEVVAALHDSPVSWLDAHAMHRTVPITRHRGCAGLPDRLVKLLEAALAKDPKDRPADAGAFARALGDILYEDLGAVDPARIRLVDAPPGTDDLVLAPGRRTVGRGPRCDLRLDAPDVAEVHAVFDWSGTPRIGQIRPVEGLPVARNGEAVATVADVEPGDVIAMGSARFVVLY